MATLSLSPSPSSRPFSLPDRSISRSPRLHRPISTLRFVPLSPLAAAASVRYRRDVLRVQNGWTHKSHIDFGIARASSSGVSPSDGDDVNDLVGKGNAEENSMGVSFLAKFAIALGIVATIAVLSYLSKFPTSGPSFEFPIVVDSSSHSAPLSFPAVYTFKLFRYKIFLPEYTPGWIYFWLLMAAGCGLFISEEALNVWVGTTLARKLSLDGTWSSFAHSFSNDAPYIISTVLWMYWGVCISDMIPFYLGKLFRQTKASEDICYKLGIGKDKVVNITSVVQKYGNLIGFVERFSIGVRNSTAFLAGAWGISADCFFAGVCFGGIFTLLIQLAIGFLVRDHPLVALASVASFVGIFTAFPYILAASTAVFLYFRRRKN